MTSRTLAAPSPGWAGAVCLLLIATVLSGCIYSGGMMAASLVGDAAGASATAAQSPGTGIQNGRYIDPSIGQALAASEGLPEGICRARLPKSDPLAAGECAQRPVCLPGASEPTVLHVCSSSH